MAACPMFDRSRLHLAQLYLAFGNYADALAELDSLSPSVAALPPVLSMRKQCLNLAVEQWRSRTEGANELVNQFPGYAAGWTLRAFCRRQFEQATKRTVARPTQGAVVAS